MTSFNSSFNNTQELDWIKDLQYWKKSPNKTIKKRAIFLPDHSRESSPSRKEDVSRRSSSPSRAEEVGHRSSSPSEAEEKSSSTESSGPKVNEKKTYLFLSYEFFYMICIKILRSLTYWYVNMLIN